MSSLVLLNREGVVARKLQLVSLPDDYIVPEGMTISWKMELHVWSSIRPAEWLRRKEPVEAYFYLRNAWGQVCRSGFREFERGDRVADEIRYNPRDLTITVQGTSTKDVLELRNHIMHLIDSCVRWEVSNDLNPKIGFLRRLFGTNK